MTGRTLTISGSLKSVSKSQIKTVPIGGCSLIAIINPLVSKLPDELSTATNLA
jgi:hypothetical protein